MLKRDAIKLFGSITEMAEAMEISRQAIHRMPEELSLAQADRVIGACHRLQMEIPPEQAQAQGQT